MIAFAHDCALRMQQRHQGRGRIVAAVREHVLGPGGDAARAAGVGGRRVPVAGAGIDLARHADRDHQLDQRRRIRRDEALRAAAGQWHEAHARPVGVGQPGVGAPLGVGAVGKVADVAHRAGGGADGGNQALRMVAREQHVGPHRGGVRREGDDGQVEAGEVVQRCAAALGVGGGLEVLGANGLQQGLGELVGRHLALTRRSADRRRTAAGVRHGVSENGVAQDPVVVGAAGAQNSYLIDAASARPAGSATRGSQPAPTTLSTLWRVNGGSRSKRLRTPTVIVVLRRPL